MSNILDLYKSQEGYDIIQRIYDESIETWSVRPESIFIETSIAKTHLLVAGDRDKPALFFFHGWNGSAAGNHLELDLARLVDHYCFYMPDTPGQMGRSEAIRHDTRSTDYVDWVRDMLDVLNIERAYLSGVSGGGYLTMKATSHLDKRVIRSLGIVSHGIPSASFPPARFFAMVFRSMLMGKRGWRYFGERMAHPNPVSDEFADFMVTMNEHYKPRMNPKPLSDDELRAIQCPVNLIFARHDITMNLKPTIERAKRLIDDVEIEVLENEGHILSEAGRKVVNDCLVGWTKKAF